MADSKKKRFVRPYQDGLKYRNSLGYRSWEEFFDGLEWQTARKKRLTKHPKCLFCESKATKVFLFELTESSLTIADHRASVTLCEECDHAICHDGDKKRTMEGANHTIREMANARKMHEFLSATAFAGRSRPSEKPKTVPNQVKCKTCGKNPCKKNRVECGRCRQNRAEKEKVVVANTTTGQCEGCSRVKSGLAGCSIEGLTMPSDRAVMLCEGCRTSYRDGVTIHPEYLAPRVKKKKADKSGNVPTVK